MASSDAEMKKLKDENVRLNGEMVAIKEFFGYDANDGLSQMEERKSKCEAKDSAERARNVKYDESCKRDDHLSDLGVKLGECAYKVSILNNKLRKCCGPTGPALRKEFVRSFNGFKATVNKEHVEEFFSIVIEWIELQLDIWKLEEQVENV
jgi:hypothetical protein